ncbi:MAG: aspartyl protease family protein, partial [Bacteroidota bacterium]
MQLRNALILLLSICFISLTFAQDTGIIPFKMVKGAIIIEVEIADSTYNFVLDTGGYLSISKEIQERLSLMVSSSVTVSDINKNEKVFEKAILPQIVIGGLVFQNREAIIISDYGEYPDRCFGISGMIGRDFLRGKITYFDYAKQEMRITEEANHIPALESMNYTRLKTSKRGLPDIKIEIDGKKRFIELDSGSPDFISFKTAELESILAKENAKHGIRAYEGIFSFGVAGKSYTPTLRYSRTISEWRIGHEIFQNTTSQLSKPSAARMGAGLLLRGIVALDWKNNRFYFDTYENHQLPIEENFGFDIGKIRGEHTIKWVEKGTAAERQGLQYGDIVLSINGRDPAKWDECNCYLNGYGYEADET